MQKPSPVFPDQPGCFSEKWRFVSQGVEIIKDKISCLIRCSQDLQKGLLPSLSLTLNVEPRTGERLLEKENP
jgi:hypothetical protein